MTVDKILTDYPDGDGVPNCLVCKGRGVTPIPPRPGMLIPGTMPCVCVMQRDILANVERGWRGLSKADKVPISPLLEREGKSLWITSSNRLFKAHLRHVAVRNGPKWGFVVVSDADLMDAWLSRVDDRDIYDGDIEQMRRQPVTSRYGALVDMVEPPELLVIVTGVKAARNSAMHEVLLEALRHREHINKPTWVVDQPDSPLKSGHISYSPQVGEFLSYLLHVKLRATGEAKPKVPQMPPGIRPVPSPGIRHMTLNEDLDSDVEAPVERSDDPPPTRATGPTRSELDNIQTVSAKFKKYGKGGK